MTTYNTGNPLGSTSPKDLYDNAENFDAAMNDVQVDTWTDRFGRPRKTYRALERLSDPGTAVAAAERSEAAADRAEDAADIAMQYSGAVPYETRALMEADTSRPDDTKGWVWGDTAANNGLYVYSAGTSTWSRAADSAQPASMSALDAVSLSTQKAFQNFSYCRYQGFGDRVKFAVVDLNGRKLDSDTLVSLLRTAARSEYARYQGFGDLEGYVTVDRNGRRLPGGGAGPTGNQGWSGPIYIRYVHSSNELYVAWPHDRSMMFRVLWRPNGHNSLFNFRAIWWAAIGDPETASWSLIQQVDTDYVPPITHHATTGILVPNVSTTGGNHAGQNGETTAEMQYCKTFLNGAELISDWRGYAEDIVVSWQNLLCAGNTVTFNADPAQNSRRFTTRQEMRAKFGARTTEIVSKVTALEPIMIWREGGTQIMGTGWDVSYHFYGGIQQGSVAADSGVLDSGTKAEAPDVWACVLKSSTFGYAAAWLDRSYGIGSAGVTDADYMATKQTGAISPATYKFYNFPIKFEALPHYVMEAGSSYTWRGGYSYAPLEMVDGLDSGFLFSQNGRLRIAIANSVSDLGGIVVLPDDIPSTDFETVGGLDSIGTAVSFATYSAQAYKEVN